MNWEPVITAHTFKHEYLYAHVQTGMGVTGRMGWIITGCIDPSKEVEIRASGYSATEELARSAAEVVIRALIIADTIALPKDVLEHQ